MWESPSWIGSAITAKLRSRSTEYSADVGAEASKYNADVRAAVDYARMELDKDIADANRQSNEEIQRLRRELDEKIAENRNVTDLEVAGIRAAAGAATEGIKILPLALGLSGKSNDGSSKLPPSTLNTGKSPVPTPVQEKVNARKKADDLFPDLEPTFGTIPEIRPRPYVDSSIEEKLNQYANKSKSSLNLNIPKGVSMLNAAGAIGAATTLGTKLLTMVPFI